MAYLVENLRLAERLDESDADRALFLQSLIKRSLCLGNIEKAAKALSELRALYGDEARFFESITPYLPLGNALSEELAVSRLAQVIQKADRDF